MDKRYQVFLSSTFEDLKEERMGILQSLLNAKYIPAGMEMFAASNDEQFEYIKKIINICDYYILVIGGRYGSINPTTGISFTEQEYDYAVSKNIPVLTFVHNNPDNLPPVKRDDDNKDLLDAFIDKVSTNRLCKPWKNMSDLVASVIISLTEVIDEYPQFGWIRGSFHDTTELLTQINNLRTEKENLEKDNKMLKEEIRTNSIKIENLASGNDKFLIKGKTFFNKKYIKSEIELTWDEIFSALAPFLFSFKGYQLFKQHLVSGVNSAYGKNFSSINEDCVQTIKVQLIALGLLKVTTSTSTSGGVHEFIGLTQKGKDYLILIKTLKNK